LGIIWSICFSDIGVTIPEAVILAVVKTVRSFAGKIVQTQSARALYLIESNSH